MANNDTKSLIDSLLFTASNNWGIDKKEILSAVARKRKKKQGVGGKPTNVKTFV